MDSETRQCAVVDASGLAINLIVADSNTLPPEGCQLIDIAPDQPFDIGWTWDGSSFVDTNNLGST